MGIREHAMREFKAAGWLDQPIDEMQQAMMDHLLVMCDTFAAEQHSGFSANYAIACLSKLLKFEPLVPLTGEDWEWNNVSEESGYECYQNNRCSHVFKQADRFDGQAYDINGKIFYEWVSYPDIDNGNPYKSYYTCSDSFVPITFPYTPKSEYVERKSEAE